MSGRVRALVAALTVAAAAVALVLPQIGAGQATAPAVVPEPVLGTADLDMTLLGAVSDGGEPGETWGYRRLPVTAGEPVSGGRPVGTGRPADPRDEQLAFLRYTSGSEWRVVQTPVDENGDVYRGPLPNEQSARMTPRGSGLLVGRDPAREQGGRDVVVLARDPGGRFRVLPSPPVGNGSGDVLRPADATEPAEAIAADRGSGRVVDAAVDEDGRAGAFFAAIGRDAEEAVVHWDGTKWTREPVQIPSRLAGDEFEIVAISASSPGNAWLLARTDARHDRGIALFRRSTAGEWVDAGTLGGSKFAASSFTGASDVAALAPPASPLTVTPDGVWVDGAFDAGGARRDFTIFYDIAQAKVTGSWCDAPGDPCEHDFGSVFGDRDGYRSFAWPGRGFGTRVITNPLETENGTDTNRGAWLRLKGTEFARQPGAGGNGRRGGAFTSPVEGWLDGPVHITTEPRRPDRLRARPVALREPIAAVAPEPGKPAGALDAAAVAVGADGAVARHVPGTGWTREFLLTSSGAVSKPTLRGVAWPEASRAHGVGDLGAMWLWRSDTGLWERDPAAPIGFEANMMDVEFDPASPERGYAVGRAGTLLRYDKTWTQEALPAGFQAADLTAIAFAGAQAIVAAGGDLLLNDGGAWRVDEDARRLLDAVRAGEPRLFAVAALPDGGAVAAGRDLVIIRDNAGAPWRFADQPLSGATVVAAAATRSPSDSPRVSPVVSVVPRVIYPTEEPQPPPDPNVPPPLAPAFPLPPDGYLLRESGDGWRDEQNTSFLGSGIDRPLKSDPILALDLASDGEGWAVGGWGGEADSAGRGSSGRNAQGRADRARVQTAGIYRYSQAAPAGPGAAGGSTVDTGEAKVRFAVAGHAACERSCADLAEQGIAPDRSLSGALAQIDRLGEQPNGPRFALYTGGRTPSGSQPQSRREAHRFAALLDGETPVYPALSEGDSSGRTTVPFRSAFAAFAAPFGQGAPPPGIAPASSGGGPDAHTHYAFDSSGSGGVVRVIVIDNSAGSLASSDPLQDPAEPQLPWLRAQLAEARARGIPSVVMGSRDLNEGFNPALNVASDGDEVAQVLVEGGASAYFFERPEENRALRIPAGASETIPEFGTGTLGYRSPTTGGGGAPRPDSLFGDSGFLLAEVDTAARDASTNRAPVTVRLIPAIEDLSLQPVDGTLIRRSRPALFQGLGRRPRAGDRWGDSSGGDGNASPPGGDPYVAFPAALCLVAGCDSRVTPEYEFSSSDPAIGDFVRQDPQSSNPRKPFIGTDDKVVTDSSSGLFCAFFPGETTVTVRAGGLAYSQVVRVLAGSVQRPCGTRVQPATRFPPRPPAVAPPPAPAPAPAPAANPPLDLVPPPPPAAPPAAVVAPPAPVRRQEPPRAPAQPGPQPLGFPPSAPPPLAPSSGPRVPGTTPPQTPGGARPIPPGGAVARVFQVEEKKEEELATEESNAFSSYSAGEHEGGMEAYLIGLVLLAALAGAAIRLPPAGQRARRTRPTAATAEVGTPIHRDPYRRKRR